jgi:hypothetical protein
MFTIKVLIVMIAIVIMTIGYTYYLAPATISTTTNTNTVCDDGSCVDSTETITIVNNFNGKPIRKKKETINIFYDVKGVI